MSEKVDVAEKETLPDTNTYAAPLVVMSIKELADAALSSLERIDTIKLAALGRDQYACAVSDARRFLDRLLVEAKMIMPQER